MPSTHTKFGQRSLKDVDYVYVTYPTKRELLVRIGPRHRMATRGQRSISLDEFVAVTAMTISTPVACCSVAGALRRRVSHPRLSFSHLTHATRTRWRRESRCSARSTQEIGDGHGRIPEHPHGDPGSRRLCRRLVLGAGDQGSASAQRAGAGAP